MDITPYLSVIVTVVLAVGGVYAAISSRLTRLETRIEDLIKDVEKHNGVIERTSTLEADVKNLYYRYNELKENRHD